MRLIVAAVGHRMPSWVHSGFEEYARRHGRGAIAKLATDTGIAYSLLWRYKERRTVPSFDNAQRIEEATGGEVKAAALCTMKRKRG
jgi:23S rRNA pseudoU1915 N3-methylase RlmH